MTSPSSGPGEAREHAAPPQLATPFDPAATPAPPQGDDPEGAGDGRDERGDTEAAVAAFLKSNPGFFERHPALVAGLRIPHDSGAAISLVEHQVGVLRAQLDDERRRVAHIIARAREYEALSARLHGLTLALIAAPNQARVEEVLHDAMCRDLNAQCVTLKLFPLSVAEGSTDPLVAAFRDFLGRRHCLCGPLDPDKSRLLFEDSGAEVRSAALIPIRAGERSGVLAIGSGDAARFRPDMATDILDRMGEVVGQCLQTLDQGQ
jgi:uncharacterized protein YigA (DUF484 family)